MFGDPWTTSGGKALAFHSSVRLRLKKPWSDKTESFWTRPNNWYKNQMSSS